ncbi:MAG: ABC transporter ATP-binding protein, partial [Rubrivivax sp.]|nr:ABC transporter ATP-binding protein [Rubrivivax sp.]
MAWFSAKRDAHAPRSGTLLEIEGLDVYYGRAHALQGVDLRLDAGVLAIVGRNGMGKTTLCNAITGLVPARGSVRLAGEEILGMAPHLITRRGIAYVPQGRRVWPSLTVDETLRLVAPQRRDVDRVYAMFPRLAERKGNGGSQLSGGEQQMLAIGRALLLQPRLLVMDEPTEGLAPLIVEHVVEALRDLSGEQQIAVLLIEQNIGVAVDVADRIGVMVNGRIAQELPAAILAADRELQERLLGVRSSSADEAAVPLATLAAPLPPVLTVRRAYGDERPQVDSAADAARTSAAPNRWTAAG